MPEQSPLNYPSNMDAERSVLGSFLLDPVVCWEQIDIEASDFYEDSHAKIYEAMLEVKTQGLTPDLTLVSEELRKAGELDGCGGYVYLANLEQFVLSSSAGIECAGIVKEKAQARKLMKLAQALLKTAAEEGDLAVAIANASREISAIDCGGWETPVPLSEFTDLDQNLPEFPLDCLPWWGRNMVETVARDIQAPACFCANLWLGNVASVLTGKLGVKVYHTYYEHCNLYLAGA